MACRQTEYAKRTRRELIEKLGGKCVHCGEGDVEKLELDHINGRDWVLNKFSSSQRAAIYKREAVEGKLQVLCSKCNLAKRFKNKETLPEAREAAEIFQP